MNALHLMYERKDYVKPDLTVERLMKLIHNIRHKMGPVYAGEVLKIRQGVGFKEVKILFPLKHLNDEITNYLNKIPEIDRWHLIDDEVISILK